MNSHIFGTLIYALILLILLLSIGYLLMLFHRFLDHVFERQNRQRALQRSYDSTETIVYVEHLDAHTEAPPTYDEVVKISEFNPDAFPIPKLIISQSHQ